MGAGAVKNTGSFGRHLKYTFPAWAKKTPRFKAGGLIPVRNSGWGCTKESPNQVLQTENIAGPCCSNNTMPIIVGGIRTGGGENRRFDESLTKLGP